MNKNYSIAAILGGTLLIFQACSSSPPKRMTLAEIDAPKWVLKGSSAYEDSSGKAFYGVGSASGIKNFSLQRTASDDRARNDLAKVLEFYTKSLIQDYMASTTSGNFTTNLEEQMIEAGIKNVASATLTGVQIIDHWEHPYRNELFSLARLELDKFKQNLGQYEGLSESVRKAVKDRASKLHEKLEMEIMKKERLR